RQQPFLQSEAVLDVAKALEETQQKEEQEKINKTIQEEFSPEKHLPPMGKNVLILLLVIAGIFILAFGGFTAYSKITGAQVVNIDELHQKNLEGDLNDKEGYVYNGYSFVFTDGLWWTEMDKFGSLLKIPLHFGPKEVEPIELQGTLHPAFNEGNEMYIAIDPDVVDKYYTLAISELSFNVVKGLDRTPVGSCTKENWACENRTIVSCDAVDSDNLNYTGKDIIELALGNETKIEAKGTCIKVTGNQYELVKAVDRLLYQWYGVIRS
ncbi:hypothetical protein HYX13_05805, partial [Candidatus Woesearchaeota archaeon]|nr:hypothetical protein [Candidatus Woesearchaeota archaeon]